jgi:hypothetical protein
MPWTAAPSVRDVSSCGLEFGAFCNCNVSLFPWLLCHQHVAWTEVPPVRGGRVILSPKLRRRLQSKCQHVAWTAALFTNCMAVFGRLDYGANCKGRVGVRPEVRHHPQRTCRRVAWTAELAIWNLSSRGLECGVNS